MVLKFGTPHYRATIAITIYLQIILWASMIGIVMSLSALAIAAVDIVLRPASILLFVSSFLSILYLVFHTFAAKRRRSSRYKENANMLVKRPAYVLTRMTIFLIMAWLITTGWNLIVAARQPVCLPGGILAAYWQAGGACIAQRLGAAIAVILLITSSALFATLEMSHDPLRSHLFGITRDRDPIVDPIEYRTASIHQRLFPRPGGPVKEWEKSLAHSHNHSISLTTTRGPMREGTDAIDTKPLPLLTGTTIVSGLGATMNPRALGEFPVSRPGTAFDNLNRGSVAPELTNLPPRGSRQVIRASRSTPSLSLISPPARVLRASHSTNSLNGAFSSHHPYMRGHSRSASGSSLSLPGFNPPLSSSLLRAPPPPTSMTDSAWKAVHPPANQFRHVGGSAPYLPFSSRASASASASSLNVPITYANSRLAAREQGLAFNVSCAQSVAGYANHSRKNSSATVANYPRSIVSHASSSNFSDPVRAWVGTQQRLLRSASVGEVDSILGPPPVRREEMDLARRLERKLMEVQRRLDAQNGGVESESESARSYSLGEIERSLSISPVPVNER